MCFSRVIIAVKGDSYIQPVQELRDSRNRGVKLMENRLSDLSWLSSKEPDICVFLCGIILLSIRLGLCGILFFHVRIFLGLHAFLGIFISFSSIGSVASGF